MTDRKLEWYYHTFDEDDYNIHKSQFQGLKEFYDRKGYKTDFYSLDDPELGWKLWFTVHRIDGKPEEYR